MSGYTMELRLCDDEGMVDGEYVAVLNRLRRLSGHAPYDGTPFVCTGSAHLAGEYIRCTSTAHAPQPAPLAVAAGFANAVVGLPINGWQVATTADALPERPDRIDDPLPEDLERLLRDPEILTGRDYELHFWLADHARRNPDATITRNAYLNLWALYVKDTGR